MHDGRFGNQVQVKHVCKVLYKTKVHHDPAVDDIADIEEAAQFHEFRRERVAVLGGLLLAVFDNGLFEEGHSYRIVFSDGVRSTDGRELNTEFKDTVAFTVDRTAPKVVNIEKTVNLTGKLPDFRITF